MLLATKTKQAIEDAIRADQGSRFRGLLRKILPTIEDAYREESDPFRKHLGASVIGEDCPRKIWYGFRWAKKPKHTGRLLRLFNRGHLEEARFIAMLQLIGCTVWSSTETGEQIKFKSHKGHAGGALDSVILGIPDDPGTRMTSEYKTHAAKSFAALEKEGVRSAKFEHFVQVQIGMGRMGISRCLYMAVNKDNDELHLEIVDFDRDVFSRFDERTDRIVNATEPPPKINSNPSWFKCKFCDTKGICHGDELPHVNCRTCSHVVMCDDGVWECQHPQAFIATGGAVQLTETSMDASGCPGYVSNPVFKNPV